ncbi:hypothetical protein AURDEDRAFT_171660 [Auricularia subglabra TFB-10046 SS5]|nr:hypothetical protein AURDEDRAFT_171660 [Auricularia subglabra TFB-10046 SS5]
MGAHNSVHDAQVVPFHESATSMPNPTAPAKSDYIPNSAATQPLPVELLQEILLYALYSAKAAQPAWPSPRSCVRIPFRVASVCRHWRRVALGTLPLWSDITLRLHAFNGPHTQLSYLRLMLQRSDPAPIDIFLLYDYRGVSLQHRRAFESGLFPELANAAHRWRTFLWNVPAACMALNRPSLFEIPTPLLEEFCLDFNGSTRSFPSPTYDSTQFPAYLPHCPSLRKLVLRGTGRLALVPHISQRALPALTYLDLKHAAIAPETQWDILRRAPNLRSLKLGDMNSHSLGFAPFAPKASITLSSLQTLTVPLETEFIENWAPHLGVPNLQALDARNIYHWRESLERLLPHIHTECLTTLSFIDGAMPQALVAELSRFTAIRHLIVKVDNEDQLPPLELFVLLRDGVLFPNLEILQIEQESPPSRADIEDNRWPGDTYPLRYHQGSEALLDFVRSRNAPPVGATDAARLVRLKRLILRPLRLPSSLRAGIGSLVHVEEQPLAIDDDDDDDDSDTDVGFGSYYW